MSPQQTTMPVYRKATYQDVLDAPLHKVAEVLDGDLYTHPLPAPRHANAGSVLGMAIGAPYNLGNGRPGGWWTIDKPELHLGEDILVPDLAGWRRKRMPSLPETAYFSLAPDWVCEVLSPSTRKFDLGGKREVYAREGVPYLWFIDPETRTLEAFELRDGHWALLATLVDDAQVSLPPFDAIGFPLGSLWAE